MADDCDCVLYLKGQSRGCRWAQEDRCELFAEYCSYIEHIICEHNVSRVIWDGDPPEEHAFSERFPELFCRLSKLRSPTDSSLARVKEIKAFRLKDSTQELVKSMFDAFESRNLGPLCVRCYLLGGTKTELTSTTSGGGVPPVFINIQESDVLNEGRNPYIALGWYSLTRELPWHKMNSTSQPSGASAAGADELQAPASKKVVVCLGGGATCNLEYENACSAGIDSLWYCLYLPPRLPPVLPETIGTGAAADEEKQHEAVLQSSVNLAHVDEAVYTVTSAKWRFGGHVYHTAR